MMTTSDTRQILTIGYASATQHALVQKLVAAEVEVLADLRSIAASRRPGFSKTSLKAAVEEAGIAYLHLRDLGTPKEGRDAARRGDRATLERVYESQLKLPEALAQMAHLQSVAAQKRTCLLCYCEEADSCHRALLAAEAFANWRRIDLATGAGPT